MSIGLLLVHFDLEFPAIDPEIHISDTHDALKRGNDVPFHQGVIIRIWIITDSKTDHRLRTWLILVNVGAIGTLRKLQASTFRSVAHLPVGHIHVRTVFEVKLNSGAPFVTMGFDALQTPYRAQLLFQGDSDFFHGFWRNPHIPADIDRNVVSLHAPGIHFQWQTHRRDGTDSHDSEQDHEHRHPAPQGKTHHMIKKMRFLAHADTSLDTGPKNRSPNRATK